MIEGNERLDHVVQEAIGNTSDFEATAETMSELLRDLVHHNEPNEPRIHPVQFAKALLQPQLADPMAEHFKEHEPPASACPGAEAPESWPGLWREPTIQRILHGGSAGDPQVHVAATYCRTMRNALYNEMYPLALANQPEALVTAAENSRRRLAHLAKYHEEDEAPVSDTPGPDWYNPLFNWDNDPSDHWTKMAELTQDLEDTNQLTELLDQLAEAILTGHRVKPTAAEWQARDHDEAAAEHVRRYLEDEDGVWMDLERTEGLENVEGESLGDLENAMDALAEATDAEDPNQRIRIFQRTIELLVHVDFNLKRLHTHPQTEIRTDRPNPERVREMETELANA